MPLSERIQDLRARPHHEKKRAVYGLAAVGASFVAVAWLGGSLASNSFAVVLPPQEGAGVESVPQGGNSNQPQYAGAASALAPADDSTPGIQIISTATSSSLSGKKTEQTVIPF